MKIKSSKYENYCYKSSSNENNNFINNVELIKNNNETSNPKNLVDRVKPIDSKNHDKTISKILDVVKEKFKNKKTLYLYFSGGGGHKSAKDAQMEKELKLITDEIIDLLKTLDDKEGTEAANILFADSIKFKDWCVEKGLIAEKDVLHDFLGKKVGEWATNKWDNAQKAGDVIKQESLASKQWLSDLVFGPFIFFKTLRNLIKQKPDKIVSTQAMATLYILLAIQIYNVLYKPKGSKDVKLHLYMTDMPTHSSGHFFNSLKKLWVLGGKKHLILYAPKISNDVTWKVLCNLPNNQVVELETDELPVRPAFLKAAEEYQNDPEKPKVQIKVSCLEELTLLHKVLNKQGYEKNSSLGSLEKTGSQTFHYDMEVKDENFFLMLGSQPTPSAIKDYVNRFIDQARANPENKYNMFVFAGKFEGKDKPCFYKELCHYVEEKAVTNWPQNLRVLPLSFQDPSQLVGLELQCHTITRSGGGTAMELLVLESIRKKLNLEPKKRLIHAQKVKNRNLINSIPLWEKGNFYFLKDQLKAAVISPNTLF